jgi:hypothetical protein
VHAALHLVGQPLDDLSRRRCKRQITVSVKNINSHEDRAKGTLKKETPIEIRKIKGMAKPLKKWYLANLWSRSSLVFIGPLMMYHHSKASSSRARPTDAA